MGTDVPQSGLSRRCRGGWKANDPSCTIRNSSRERAARNRLRLELRFGSTTNFRVVVTE